MVIIPRDTVVEVETAYRVSSQEIRDGEAISFKVVNPVQVGGNTVIAVGAIATGRVVLSQPRRTFWAGRPPGLDHGNS